MERSGDDAGALRRVLLALVILGMLGLAAELWLLEHTEPGWQWAPFVVLALGLVAGAAVAVRPARGTLLFFRGVMALFIAAGLAGLYLHYAGNAAFERESDPAVRGAELFTRSLYGATPTLAPGAMAQLGLIGLALAWRHPRLRTRTHPSTEPGEEG
ncbi:MAG TPA: hypothetical protein VFQ45_09970 [Longimicrobium sp.]|nr:hypothetical protein [Longimicrobium sp.]